MITALTNELSTRLSTPMGRITGLLALLTVLLGVSPAVPGAALELLTLILINILLAQSLYLLTGLSGQISLGQAGFIGIGAYGSALLTREVELSFPLAILLATLISGCTGYLLAFPAGKLNRIHMAVITLGFGLIAQEVAVDLTQLIDDEPLTDLPSAALHNLTVLGFRLSPLIYFQLVLTVTVVVVFLLSGTTRSSSGRAFHALRDGQAAAAGLAISPTIRRRRAYMFSGALAGLAGAFQAHLTGVVDPSLLDFSQSLAVLMIVLLGGIGSIAGQCVSAALVTIGIGALPVLLPYYDPYQSLLYGSVIALTLLLAPRGIGACFPAPRFIQAGILRLAGSRRVPAVPRVIGHATTAGLVVGNISLQWRGRMALSLVSFTLQPGRVTALIGPNGAGKSTLIDTLTGIHVPDDGKTRFFGRTTSNKAAEHIAALGLRRSFQIPRLVPDFTIRENLMLGPHRRLMHNSAYVLLGLPFALRDEANLLCQANALIDLIGLTETADHTIETLPHGARKLTDIARQIMSGPRALLLDEPTAGLSDRELTAMSGLILKMKQAGIILLISEPYLDFIAPLVDDVVVLDQGRVIYVGNVDGLRTNAGVIAAYHGKIPTPVHDTVSG